MAVKIDKQTQELAKTILESKGSSYEKWINEQHLSVITSNVKVIQESLNSRKTT